MLCARSQDDARADLMRIPPVIGERRQSYSCLPYTKPIVHIYMMHQGKVAADSVAAACAVAAASMS